MKNEKVALVFFAYVIGFTTAFIAFALNDNGHSKDKIVNAKNHQEVIEEIKMHSRGVELVNGPEGLFVLSGDEERILSATALEGMSGEGFHTEIFTSSVSPNEQYVHFCASLVGDPGICTNFVYGIQDDLMYRVRVGEELLKLSMEESGTVSWANDNTLRFPIGSAGADTNWSIR